MPASGGRCVPRWGDGGVFCFPGFRWLWTSGGLAPLPAAPGKPLLRISPRLGDLKTPRPRRSESWRSRLEDKFVPSCWRAPCTVPASLLPRMPSARGWVRLAEYVRPYAHQPGADWAPPPFCHGARSPAGVSGGSSPSTPPLPWTGEVCARLYLALMKCVTRAYSHPFSTPRRFLPTHIPTERPCSKAI